MSFDLRRLTDRPCSCWRRTTSWAPWTLNWDLHSRSSHASTCSKTLSTCIDLDESFFVCACVREERKTGKWCPHSTDNTDWLLHYDLITTEAPQALKACVYMHSVTGNTIWSHSEICALWQMLILTLNECIWISDLDKEQTCKGVGVLACRTYRMQAARWSTRPGRYTAKQVQQSHIVSFHDFYIWFTNCSS